MTVKVGRNDGVPNNLSELFIRKEDGEGVIEDEMKLGRDDAGLKSEDKSNIESMFATISQKKFANTRGSSESYEHLLVEYECRPQDDGQLDCHDMKK